MTAETVMSLHFPLFTQRFDKFRKDGARLKDAQVLDPADVAQARGNKAAIELLFAQGTLNNRGSQLYAEAARLGESLSEQFVWFCTRPQAAELAERTARVLAANVEYGRLVETFAAAVDAIAANKAAFHNTVCQPDE